MSQSRGIQTLLEAEKEAAKVVQEARQYRVQRLKEARTQAQKEIEAYAGLKNAEFEKIEEKTKGLIDKAQAAVDRDIKIKLLAVGEAFGKNKDAVAQKLLDRVVLVEPKLHRNLTKANRS